MHNAGCPFVYTYVGYGTTCTLLNPHTSYARVTLADVPPTVPGRSEGQLLPSGLQHGLRASLRLSCRSGGHGSIGAWNASIAEMGRGRTTRWSDLLLCFRMAHKDKVQVPDGEEFLCQDGTKHDLDGCGRCKCTRKTLFHLSLLHTNIKRTCCR